MTGNHQTKFIIKFNKNTNIIIAYKTNNNTGNILTHNTSTNNIGYKFNQRGMYQLNCKDCNKKYIGQNGSSFYTRFREHFNDFEHGKWSSIFAQNVIESWHSIGPIDDIIEMLHTVKKQDNTPNTSGTWWWLHTVKKGKLMDTLQKFHIRFLDNKFPDWIFRACTERSYRTIL